MCFKLSVSYVFVPFFLKMLEYLLNYKQRNISPSTYKTLKWRVVPMYGYARPFRRHFHVVSDVRVVDLNLSINFPRRRVHVRSKLRYCVCISQVVVSLSIHSCNYKQEV